MERLIKKTNLDEHVIFFIPYPIVLDFENFPLIGSNDVLKKIYEELNIQMTFGSKQIYTIYISFDNKMVLRNLGIDCREYLDYPEINKYVNYDISSIN